jgi:hypothetical protein
VDNILAHFNIKKEGNITHVDIKEAMNIGPSRFVGLVGFFLKCNIYNEVVLMFSS